MEKEGPSKALIVYGSESGTAEKAIKELAAGWKAAGNWQVVDVIDGNAAAKQGLATLASNHDAILIATSSFFFMRIVFVMLLNPPEFCARRSIHF